MRTSPVELTREQVLAHRQRAHGLVDRAGTLAGVAVLDLGVQNSPPGSLPVALAARLANPPGPDHDLTDGGALTRVWSHRGAPHLHRTADLPALAAPAGPATTPTPPHGLAGSGPGSPRSVERPGRRSARWPTRSGRCWSPR